MENTIAVPMHFIGPVKIIGQEVNTEVKVPLATYETTMWPSTNRGASVSRYTDGIRCHIVDERMSRSILLEGQDCGTLTQILSELDSRHEELMQVIRTTSRFTKLLNLHPQVVGNLLYLRIEATTGDAAGHNMITKAADAVLRWLLGQYPTLKYVSISANICVDKKVSAINGILGRGKNVVAEILIPRTVCIERLKTTPEALVNLHIKKNLIGSIVAGGVRTANAHFANILLATYLATGQDGANVVEGSQGIVHCEMRGDDLYFSVTIPNIIVGTTGNGKHLPFVKENLKVMGCLDEEHSGLNARRLAIIIAATVLCGEISLLAAQTNPGELMRAHVEFERGSAIYRDPVEELTNESTT